MPWSLFGTYFSKKRDEIALDHFMTVLVNRAKSGIRAVYIKQHQENYILQVPSPAPNKSVISLAERRISRFCFMEQEADLDTLFKSLHLHRERPRRLRAGGSVDNEE